MPRIDRVAEPWGTRTSHAAGTDWPVRVDQHLEHGVTEDQVDRWVQSCCLLCSNGCGKDIAVKDGRIVGVRGRAVDRVNHGRLGPKGLFGWQSNNSPERLGSPLVRRNGRLEEADWDTAMELMTLRTKTLLAEKGPGSIAFYTSGQLFLEEYYALAMIGKAGIGTAHMDGNTRLCTATAAASLKETFGMDGQPGSYADVEHCDAIFLVGHNVSETQTVLWMRMLDRLEAADRPKLIVVDPRPTPAARMADVHLDPINGTNVALLNAIEHEIIRNGWIDEDYIRRNTVGFEQLRKTVEQWPPEKAAEICKVPAEQIREAARIVGQSKALLSTCLQGVYQSNQATAAACQVNNINLMRGMLGRPGAGILQMNGQPTAQNTRETGCDGDLTGFRNWENFQHVIDLARIWNVDPYVIPHATPPTHIMRIIRYIEEGSINFLWVSCTNPAVSLPELDRIRRVLADERLFLVVSDAFLTETAQFADVVLPAAIWGEKTGTYTNADRTVHISEKAVDPPGEARSDLDIFLDYARRMDFRNEDGQPLITFSDPEGAFEAWKEASRGRPCDYTGITYEKLRGGSGIQWPCNDERPEGTERLYADGSFWAHPEYCESYGKDPLTGAAATKQKYGAFNPGGKAMFRWADYSPPHEAPDDGYPFVLSTGRTLYHFHTRTKTGRARQLQGAAPDAWVEMSPTDARRLNVSEGDLVRVESPRGAVESRVRVGDIKEGTVFVPFHYGYWDDKGRGPDGRPRAANELTLTMWDPVSKQPYFKFGKARVIPIASGEGAVAPAPTTTASAPVAGSRVSSSVGGHDAEVNETIRQEA